MRYTLGNVFSPAARSAPLLALLLGACASSPTTELAPLDLPPEIPTRAGNLVDIHDVDPDIQVELRYAGSNNITGAPLYPRDMPCLVNRDTAGKLRLANDYLKARGYRLKIWDAYRPPAVQRKLYAAAPDHGWVAEPDTSWSHHNFGTGIDVTLSDRKGRDQVMPTDFDELSSRADHRYFAGNDLVQRNLKLLQRAMSSVGLLGATGEWWHYYDVHSTNARLVYAHELGIVLPE